MFRHYLSTALRHFNRVRFTTMVNVVSLSLGLACLIVTYAVIGFMSKSDTHFESSDRIQIVSVDLNAPAVNARFDNMPLTGPVVAGLIAADIPQIRSVARRTPEQQVAVSSGDTATFASISYADPTLLSLFDFDFVAGAGAASLRSPHTAVVTEEAAVRILGRRDVLGQRLLLANMEEVTITGVIRRVPQPTRFSFELLVSMSVLDEIQLESGMPEPSAGNFGDWWWLARSYMTYVLLPANGSLDSVALNERLRAFSAQHAPKHDGGNTLELGSMPLGEMFISSANAQFGGLARTGVSVQTIGYTLAGLVLLIACLNYANLAAAMASTRGKEVGLRRVLGAGRNQVVKQHLFEAAMIGAAALLATLLFVALLTPLVRRMGFDIAATVLLQPSFVVFLLLLLTTMTLAAGAYPAIVFSSIRPNQALRIGGARGVRRWVPTVLVTLQFAASSFLLVTVLVMQSQNRAVLKLGDSFVEDPVVALTTDLDTANVDLEVLRTRLLSSPLITSVTASDKVPLSTTPSPLPLSRSPGAGARPVAASIYNVSYDFFHTMGVGVQAGRDFSRERGDDINQPSAPNGQPNHVVIGAALAAQLGWIAPENAVGQLIYFNYGGSTNPMEIIGVAEEKPLHLMGLGARSSIYFLTPSSATRAAVRIARSDVPRALAHIDAVWKELSPHVPLRRQFLDDLFEQSYQMLLRVSTLIMALSVLGCMVATIGLIGMAMYIIDRRTHEIGVRKTLGARTVQIFAMLLRDFSKPVLVANLIAWPLAFAAAQIYLRLFAERVALTAVPFVAGLTITLLVAWIAVSRRAYRASRSNPAAVLRYE